jgi:uncharacterized delta-60 repeat protein
MGARERRKRMRRLSRRTALAGVALVYAVAIAPATATAAPGDLDPSFGDAGQTSFRLSFHERVQEGEPATVAFPGDGDIELMGTATPLSGGEWRMFAARLQEDGALDPTFGSGGTVITRLPPEEEETNTIPIQSIFAGALEADGAMVGVGPRVEGRLGAAGAFDPSFRNQLQINAFALVGLPDGQMLAAGETPTEGEVARYPTLERLLADGAPDQSFGTDGLVQLPDRTGPTARESARSILLLPDGDLLLAGIGEGTGEQFGWLAEVTATGSLDRSFGDEGIDYVPAKAPFQGETGVSVAREPNGTIVLAGTASVGSEDWQAAAWGFLPDGVPDPAFGSDGVLLLPRGLPEESAESVMSTADNSGHVYVDFHQESSEPPYSQNSYVARLTPSGALDVAYGDDGLASFPTARIKAIGVDRAGRLVVAGRQGEAVFLARLIGGPTGAAPVAPVAPVVESLRQTYPAWREGTKLASLARSRARVPVGTTFQFLLSKPARARLNFAQLVSGRMSHGRCVRSAARDTRGRSCRLAVSRGSLTPSVAAGQSRLRFDGLLARRKRLPTGSYTLTLTAEAAGKRSAPKHLTFRIVA